MCFCAGLADCALKKVAMVNCVTLASKRVTVTPPCLAFPRVILLHAYKALVPSRCRKQPAAKVRALALVLNKINLDN